MGNHGLIFVILGLISLIAAVVHMTVDHIADMKYAREREQNRKSSSVSDGGIEMTPVHMTQITAQMYTDVCAERDILADWCARFSYQYGGQTSKSTYLKRASEAIHTTVKTDTK
jgi:hypothetical protein